MRSLNDSPVWTFRLLIDVLCWRRNKQLMLVVRTFWLFIPRKMHSDCSQHEMQYASVQWIKLDSRLYHLIIMQLKSYVDSPLTNIYRKHVDIMSILHSNCCSNFNQYDVKVQSLWTLQMMLHVTTTAIQTASAPCDRTGTHLFNWQ